MVQTHPPHNKPLNKLREFREHHNTPINSHRTDRLLWPAVFSEGFAARIHALLKLLGRRLIEKIRRALSVKHIMEGEYGPRIADHQVVRGRIEWDDVSDGRVPLLVVDGREVSWDDFGRMLMAFEGFQFRLHIQDNSEEV